MMTELPDFRVCSFTEYRVSLTKKKYDDIIVRVESYDVATSIDGETYKRVRVNHSHQRLLTLKLDVMNNPVWVICTYSE